MSLRAIRKETTRSSNSDQQEARLPVYEIEVA